MKKLLLVLLLLIPVNSWANSSEQIFNIKSFKCDFTFGSSNFWENGEMSFESSKTKLSFVISEIDQNTQLAKMTGNAGSSQLIILGIEPQGMSFVEKTATGNLIFTTIFSNRDAHKNHFIAVHSRHNHLIEPIPSQYHGTCEAI